MTVLHVNPTPVAQALPDLEVIEGSVLRYAVTPIASDPQGAGASGTFRVRVSGP